MFTRSPRPNQFGLAVVLTFALLSACVPRLSAISYTYDFDHTLAGVPPVGPIPWLQATFLDVGANTVQLTLSAPGLTGSEFVNQWFFNLNPALDPTALQFTQVGSAGSFASPTVLTGADAFRADWDGKYDMLVRFDGGSDAATHFDGGDSVTFLISDAGGLRASDFYAPNTAVAGHLPFWSAVSVQTVGTAIILDALPSIPDGGATTILLGVALLILEGARRKFRAAFPS